MRRGRGRAVSSTPSSPVCLRTRSRRVACVRVASCDSTPSTVLRWLRWVSPCNTVNIVPYRVIKYRDNGMPSKKKKYNARFPAVSVSSRFYPIPSSPIPSRNARRWREEMGREREWTWTPDLESARRLDSRLRCLLPQRKNMLCFLWMSRSADLTYTSDIT